MGSTDNFSIPTNARPTYANVGITPRVWEVLFVSIRLCALVWALLQIAEAAVVGVVRDEFDVERVRVVPLRR